MRQAIVFAIILLTSPAVGQQQPDPAVLQRVIPSLQAQRNAAMDAAALAEARAAQLAEEVQKLKTALEKASNKQPGAEGSN